MKKTVFAYLHTHWDREWYRDKEDFNLRLLEVFDIVLDELKKDNAPFFYFDGQVIALLDYLKFRKSKLQEVLYFIKNKKLAIGPYFVSADSYLVNFCSMLKNLDIGMKISKDYGQKDFIGYMSDIFGVSKSAFLALERKNIDKALIWRGVNPRLINRNCNFLKNNIRTSWLVQGYFNDFLHNDNIEGLEKYLDKINIYSKNPLLLPIGADHLGMLRNAKQKISEVNKKLVNYEIILSSPFDYFLNAKFDNNSVPEEFLDNSDTYLLSGVYSSRVYQKIKNATVQNRLSRIIEPLDFYLGKKYNENIDFIYKTLIKNHAHDGIYGCSIDSVQRAVDSRFEKCENAISAVLKRLVGDFKLENNISGFIKNNVGIFNLSNIDNLNVVEVKLPYIVKNSQIIDAEKRFSDDLLYDVYKIPVTEDITSIYTQLVEITSNEKYSFNTVKIKKPSKKVKVTNKSIENKNVKLEIRNGKIYVSDFKQTFQLKLTDIADMGDSYNFAPKGSYSCLKVCDSKVLYDGIIESCLEIKFRNLDLRVYLNNCSKFLRFVAKINNKNKNHKLQAVLVLDKNISKTVSDDAFGVIQRKVDYKYNLQDNMPAKRPAELKTNIFPMQNFVCANGGIFITKGLYEYEIYNNELRICLLRAIGTISNPKNKARSIPAGPDLKCIEAQCLRKIDAEFAITFGNKEKAFNVLDEFNKNYVIIDGDFTKEINFKLDEIPKNSFIYGIDNDESITYCFK